MVGDCSRTTLLQVFPRVYRGTHVDHPEVSVHRAAGVELAAEGVTGYADGEPLGPLPLTARVRAGRRAGRTVPELRGSMFHGIRSG